MKFMREKHLVCRNHLCTFSDAPGIISTRSNVHGMLLGNSQSRGSPQ